ncbi:MAG: neutral/alkaline non-lysosomal ceramidase N-terminal domain-containing protein, partial [Ferruginibacter sp.]|nr:neutral/alkaline non-lysosomal ceramidase N-terminal domain-containing protein [Cytophagales bacterium]
MTRSNFSGCLLLAIAVLTGGASPAQKTTGATVDVGVARVDITPEGPIRLSGYGWMRKTESEGVLQRLGAKALAFGSDAQGPSVLITVDLAGIPANITAKVAERLARKAGVDPARLAICASHTHSGPDVGNSHNMYSDPPLPVDQLGRIALFLDSLTPKLERVALAALQDRRPARVAWGIGEVGFALNRRVIKDGKWAGHGKVPEGPVDHALPVLSVTGPDGKVRAILTSYACHGTTLFDDINQTHGDWIGEAQRLIEVNHPGAIALVTAGCGGDADPNRRGKLEYATQHGQSIADEVERLLATSLSPLTVPPVGRLRKIELPFDHVPDVKELIALAKEEGAKGHNAGVHLERVVRGMALPTSLTYPIQTWTFGNKLAMVFLGGEVVADYSLR